MYGSLRLFAGLVREEEERADGATVGLPATDAECAGGEPTAGPSTAGEPAGLPARARQVVSLPIPDLLAHTATAWFGEAGQRWLEALPALVEECAERWTIVVGAPFEPGGAVSWVAPAHGRGDTHWVLKSRSPTRSRSTNT